LYSPRMEERAGWRWITGLDLLMDGVHYLGASTLFVHRENTITVVDL
jgi:hypothetical protein